MAQAPTAKRYAQAMFQLAQEQGQESAWVEQLQAAQALLGAPDARLYLTVPRVRAEQKVDAVRQLLAGMPALVVNMMALLVTRQGLASLPQIVSEYLALLNDSLGRVQATVTSAVPLSDQQHDHLRGLLGQMLAKEVVLEARQDPETLGGAIVQVGDQVIDGSVRTRLQALRHQLARQAMR